MTAQSFCNRSLKVDPVSLSYSYLRHSYTRGSIEVRSRFEGVVELAQWCNSLTLQPEQSGGVGSRRGRASPLERHDKGSRTRLALSYLCDPSAWR